MKRFFNKSLHRDHLQNLNILMRMNEIGITVIDIAKVLQIPNPNYVNRIITQALVGNPQYNRSQDFTDICRVVGEFMERFLTELYDKPKDDYEPKQRQQYVPFVDLP